MRFLNLPYISILRNHLIEYPTPSNLSYLWSFGFIAGMCLTTQLITGICLAMHYTPHIDYAFASIQHITRDVNGGWLLRNIHANGASMFFIVIYIHIGKGLYYRSYKYPRRLLWASGVTLLLLLMGTAFLGYVCPWGQMSFWGATVITNFASAIPYVGQNIAQWLWGGFSINNATLNRFFVLHYLLPFIIIGLVFVHLALLHLNGSSNPLGIDSHYDLIPFYPYFFLKDLFSFFIFLFIFSIFVFFIPDYLGHHDNYVEANALVTPAHIQPEWYFWPFYAILRAVPNKLGGVIAMFFSIIVLYFLPFLDFSRITSPRFSPLYKLLFSFFILNVFLLSWLGSCPVKEPYISLGQVCTVLYFLYFFLFLPLCTFFEKKCFDIIKK